MDLPDLEKVASAISARLTTAQKFKLRTLRVGVDAAENWFVLKSSSPGITLSLKK
jgi:hypothetical protein